MKNSGVIPSGPVRRASRASSVGEHLAFGALLAVLSIIPIVTLWMVVGLYDDTCAGDQLSFFAHDRLGEGLTLANLFAFFNEHQMVFTRLAVYLDYVWLHGSNVLPCLLNALLLLGVWSVYCVVLKRSSGGFSPGQLVVCSGLLLTLYFNGQMLLNITFPIMEFPWTSFLTVLAFVVFSRLVVAFAVERAPGSKRHSRVLLVGLLFGALVAAALSCAGGLLAGPAMLVVLALLLLWPDSFPRSAVWRLGVIVLALSGLITAVYVGAFLRASGGLQGERLASGVVATGRFIYVFVGGPFFNDSEWPVVHHSNLQALYVAPGLFWGVLACLAVQLFRRRHNISGFELFHWCVIVFVLLTAISGGLLRAQLGVLEGFSKKYVSIALMAWLSVVSLLLWYWPRLLFGKRQWFWLRPLAICSAAVLLILPGNLSQYRAWGVWRAEVRQAIAAVASDVYSTDLLRRLHHKRKAGFEASRAFATAGKYCFRRMPSPGYKLQDRFRVVPSARSGVLAADITSLRERHGFEGFTALGTTTRTNDEFPALVITDGDDRVAGYGTVAAVSLPDGRNQAGWEWFAAFRQPPGFQGVGTFRVYGVRGETATLNGTLQVAATPEIDSQAKSSSRLIPRIANDTDYTLDVFSGVERPLTHQPIHVALRADVELSGWAVDRGENSLPAAVDAVIDGRPYPGQMGGWRADVATRFHQPGFTRSGFSFAIPAATVGRGRHRLRIRIYVDGARFNLESAPFDFVVE